jgi:hypothetical protein
MGGHGSGGESHTLPAVTPESLGAFVPTAIAGAPDGSIVLAGITTGDFTIRGTSVTASESVAVVALNPDGSLRWARTFGLPAGSTDICQIPDNTDSQPRSVVLRADGSVAVGGRASGLEIDGIAAPIAGGLDAFLLSLGSDGTTAWSHTYGSIDDDEITALRVDTDGALLVAGDYHLNLDLVSPLPIPGGGLFVAKLDSNGTPIAAESIPFTGDSTSSATIDGWSNTPGGGLLALGSERAPTIGGMAIPGSAACPQGADCAISILLDDALTSAVVRWAGAPGALKSTIPQTTDSWFLGPLTIFGGDGEWVPPDIELGRLDALGVATGSVSAGTTGNKKDQGRLVSMGTDAMGNLYVAGQYAGPFRLNGVALPESSTQTIAFVGQGTIDAPIGTSTQIDAVDVDTSDLQIVGMVVRQHDVVVALQHDECARTGWISRAPISAMGGGAGGYCGQAGCPDPPPMQGDACDASSLGLQCLYHCVPNLCDDNLGCAYALTCKEGTGGEPVWSM